MGRQACWGILKFGGLNMTVQELIDALNKVEDKSKIVHQYDEEDIDEVIERIKGDVILY